ncbi:MAG TPA: GNAT family N-acetyltransferase [Ignavibacteria bacterium]|jgi:N-acetylglutamate synthase-like GNAT family acetyltransferase
MKIRRANISDVDEIRQLFYDTVTTINKKDYNQKQIEIWASGTLNAEGWSNKINEQYFFVAELQGKIIGFSSITDQGFIDYMYVHKDFQRQGIASGLLNVMEQAADKFNITEIWAEVSFTARPFFKSKGFDITKIYTKKAADVEFEDCIMTKKR